MIKEIPVRTTRRVEMVDITSAVQNIITELDVKSGICHLYTPHTTAAITINEAADPSVASDITDALSKLVPEGSRAYRHAEGNSDAHIKSSLIGISRSVFIEFGSLVLGTWQGIFFCEFDGPRSRKVIVKIIPDERSGKLPV